jgi:hypothetical protein
MGMFGSGVLRIFGSAREVMIECRKPRNDDLCKLYCLPDTVMVSRSRMERCMDHVGWMGEMRNVYRILFRNLKGKYTIEDLRVNERIILSVSLRSRVD